MEPQGIDNLAGTLDGIVNQSQSSKSIAPEISNSPIGEIVKDRTEETRKESEAIRDGLRAAQTTSAQVEATLRDIEQALTNLTNDLNSVLQEGIPSSLQPNLQKNARENLDSISSSNQNIQALVAELPQIEGTAIQSVDTSNLENLATGLGTNEEALAARQSLKTALQATLGNRSSVNLIAKHLGQQLVTSEDVAQGSFGLARFTDADLLLDVAKNSQLEEQLHTEVLVKAEAGQQNRRIGRLLNQLS